MKSRLTKSPRSSGPAANPRAGEPSKPKESSQPRPRRRRIWRWIFVSLAVLIVLFAIGRGMLPSFVRNYVNQTIDRNPLYDGEIGEVRIQLWRGAYAIEDVRLNKVTEAMPVPLFAAERVDFAIQWDALLDRKIVGRVRMDNAELNFVDAPEDSADQTGAGGPWLKMIGELFPFRINRAVINNGSIHFRAYHAEIPVDVYISEAQITVDNLTNIRDETQPLVSTVRAEGLAMDQAKLEFNLVLDPFSYRPTFEMALRLIGLDVTKLNDLAKTYGHFDFEDGWFDLVIEAEAREGLLSGYAKPLFRDLDVFSLTGDFGEDHVLEAFWQALVGAATNIFQNQPRDQFGTLIPFSGDLSGSTTIDVLAVIGNVLHNAFVRAYLPQLENPGDSSGALQFDPPELSDPISVGNSP